MKLLLTLLILLGCLPVDAQRGILDLSFGMAYNRSGGGLAGAHGDWSSGTVQLGYSHALGKRFHLKAMGSYYGARQSLRYRLLYDNPDPGGYDQYDSGYYEYRNVGLAILPELRFGKSKWLYLNTGPELNYRPYERYGPGYFSDATTPWLYKGRADRRHRTLLTWVAQAGLNPSFGRFGLQAGYTYRYAGTNPHTEESPVFHLHQHIVNLGFTWRFGPRASDDYVKL